MDTAAFPYSATVAAALARDSAGCSGRELSKLLLAVQAAAYGSDHCAVTPELWQRTVAWKLREYADKRNGAFSSTSTTATSSSSTSSSSTGSKSFKGTSSSANKSDAVVITEKQQPQQQQTDRSNISRSSNRSSNSNSSSSSSSSSSSNARTAADAHNASTTSAETIAASCDTAKAVDDSLAGNPTAPFCTSSSSGDDSSSSDQQPELTLAHVVAVQPAVAAVARSNSSSHDSTPEKTSRKGLKKRSVS
eukprot:2612-Heterococcus_DN1.PRE.1